MGRTALHIAVYHGYSKIVENLMFLKSDSTIKDEFGFRPIDYLDFNPETDVDEKEYIRQLLVKDIEKKKQKLDQSNSNFKSLKNSIKDAKTLDIDDLKVIDKSKLSTM